MTPQPVRDQPLHEAVMSALENLIENRLHRLSLPLALRLPSGRRLGPPDATVTLIFEDSAGLRHLALGQLGRLADDIVRGHVAVEGRAHMHVVGHGAAVQPLLGAARALGAFRVQQHHAAAGVEC